MRRSVLLAMSLLVTSVAAATAGAQEVCREEMSWKQSFHYDYYRNKMWPMPFRAMDARSVLAHFDVQRSNGWKLHNTLGASMFDPNTQQLTDSGREHVKWIVTRAPRDRRVVFVFQGGTQSETAARVESTQLAISELIPVGPLPQLYVTDQDAPGSSGAYQTAVGRAMATSIPSPRLTSQPVTVP